MRGRKHTPNKYRIEGDCAYLELTNTHGEVVGEACIDVADLGGVLAVGRWSRHQNGYARTEQAHKFVLMHRLLLNPDDSEEVDHKNRNRLDNRRENLRRCTPSQNRQNRQGATKVSVSGVRGIFWYPRLKKWRVRVQVNGQRHNVGCFSTVEEAEAAAIAARRRLMPFSQVDIDAA